ncbi:MAG: hypothetical protein ACR2QM_10760 [Longimicrobiales bacterium]
MLSPSPAWVRMGFALALTMVLAACGGDGSFETRAVYIASESGFQVTIDAQGTVAEGHNISTDGAGVARVAFLGQDSWELLLTFASSDDVTYELANGERGQEVWPVVGSDKLLRLLFDRARLVGNQGEIADVVRAIDGALMGPKSTLRQGQTGALDLMAIAVN